MPTDRFWFTDSEGVFHRVATAEEARRGAVEELDRCREEANDPDVGWPDGVRLVAWGEIREAVVEARRGVEHPDDCDHCEGRGDTGGMYAVRCGECRGTGYERGAEPREWVEYDLDEVNGDDTAVLRVELERLRAGLDGLTKAAKHLCWLCIEHAGLSEPEDIEAVEAVREAIATLEAPRG